MALVNKEEKVAQVQEQVDAVKGEEVLKASEEINKIGVAEISAMSEERVANLASKSGTLHFKYLIGLQSKKAVRVGAEKTTHESFEPVGSVWVSDVAIKVPVIDVRLNEEIGVNADQISYRNVKAGEEFALTRIEAMFLLINEEYSGFAAYEGDPRGVKLLAYAKKFWAGGCKLPTPVLNLAKTGSIKETMVPIDRKLPDGVWVIVDEYKEKFGALLQRVAPKRAESTGVAGEPKNVIPSTIATAVALRKILKIN